MAGASSYTIGVPPPDIKDLVRGEVNHWDKRISLAGVVVAGIPMKVKEMRTHSTGEDTRRIIEGRMLPREDLFQEDVTTALPYPENVVNVLGCTAIYME